MLTTVVGIVVNSIPLKIEKGWLVIIMCTALQKDLIQILLLRVKYLTFM